MNRNASVGRQAYRGLAIVLVSLAGMIFLSAWSLAYWQGWLFLAIFSASLLSITAYFLRTDPALIEHRLKSGAGAEKEASQKLIQAVASVFSIALFLFPGFDHRFGWSPDSALVAIAGEVLVVLGLAIIFVVFRQNSYASAIIETQKDQQVIDTGLYGIVRHPMYSGALIMFAGVPLALGSLWGLLWWVPLAATMVWRLRDEEQFLSANLRGYDAYCRRVRHRLLPGIY